MVWIPLNNNSHFLLLMGNSFSCHFQLLDQQCVCISFINTNIVFGVITFRQMCVYYVYVQVVCVIMWTEAHLVSAYFSLLLLFCVFFGQIHTTCFAYLCRHLTVIKTKQVPQLHLLQSSVDITNSPFMELHCDLRFTVPIL